MLNRMFRLIFLILPVRTSLYSRVLFRVGHLQAELHALCDWCDPPDGGRLAGDPGPGGAAPG